MTKTNEIKAEVSSLWGSTSEALLPRENQRLKNEKHCEKPVLFCQRMIAWQLECFLFFECCLAFLLRLPLLLLLLMLTTVSKLAEVTEMLAANIHQKIIIKVNHLSSSTTSPLGRPLLTPCISKESVCVVSYWRGQNMFHAPTACTAFCMWLDEPNYFWRSKVTLGLMQEVIVCVHNLFLFC